ncbi:hypothetical protein, partial [Escherichia coli]|uniref:hypothetical protein n=1 Tax=Escherichia coli TaxID=562 RepID=UPI001953FDB1
AVTAPPDDAGAVTAIVASPDEAAGAVAAMLSAFAASGARRVRDLATADRARVTTAGRRAVSAPPRDGGACSVAQAALPAGLSPLGRHW